MNYNEHNFEPAKQPEHITHPPYQQRFVADIAELTLIII